jgi:hypothetical protein
MGRNSKAFWFFTIIQHINAFFDQLRQMGCVADFRAAGDLRPLYDISRAAFQQYCKCPVDILSVTHDYLFAHIESWYAMYAAPQSNIEDLIAHRAWDNVGFFRTMNHVAICPNVRCDTPLSLRDMKTVAVHLANCSRAYLQMHIPET